MILKWALQILCVFVSLNIYADIKNKTFEIPKDCSAANSIFYKNHILAMRCGDSLREIKIVDIWTGKTLLKDKIKEPITDFKFDSQGNLLIGIMPENPTFGAPKVIFLNRTWKRIFKKPFTDFLSGNAGKFILNGNKLINLMTGKETKIPRSTEDSLFTMSPNEDFIHFFIDRSFKSQTYLYDIQKNKLIDTGLFRRYWHGKRIDFDQMSNHLYMIDAESDSKDQIARFFNLKTLNESSVDLKKHGCDGVDDTLGFVDNTLVIHCYSGLLLINKINSTIKFYNDLDNDWFYWSEKTVVSQSKKFFSIISNDANKSSTLDIFNSKSLKLVYSISFDDTRNPYLVIDEELNKAIVVDKTTVKQIDLTDGEISSEILLENSLTFWNLDEGISYSNKRKKLFIPGTLTHSGKMIDLKSNTVIWKADSIRSGHFLLGDDYFAAQVSNKIRIIDLNTMKTKLEKEYPDRSLSLLLPSKQSSVALKYYDYIKKIWTIDLFEL